MMGEPPPHLRPPLHGGHVLRQSGGVPRQAPLALLQRPRHRRRLVGGADGLGHVQLGDDIFQI
eukprot:8082637-Pyramimonas_sp.AAC.1